MDIELNKQEDTTPQILTNMMYSSTDVIGRKIYYVEYDQRYIPKEQVKNVQEHTQHIKEGLEPSPIYIPIQQEDFIGTAIIYSKDGTPTHLLFSEDIDRVVDLQNKLTIDPVTGINNRYGWNIALEKLADMIQRGEMDDKYITLSIFDLNNLKKINDEQGHIKGDEYIVQMAQHLRSTFRSYDEIARWAGDEFVALAIANRSIESTIEKRLNKLRDPNLNYCAGIIGFSIKEISDELENREENNVEDRSKMVLEILEEKLNQADKLLYEAKETAKGKVENNIKPTIIKDSSQ